MTEYASIQNVALFVNAVNRTIQRNGVTKIISDEYWMEHIVPILYPIWDSDRDKLETFVHYKDGTSLVMKNKYQRNQKTNEYKWVSYEMNLSGFPQNELKQLYEEILEKYVEFRDIQEYNLESALRSQYMKDNIVNWNKILMIRKFLLLDSDWTMLPDSPITDDEKEQWKLYRQKLRDIPEDQYGVPSNQVYFPITPLKYKKQSEEMESPPTYLSDSANHFFTMNQSVYTKYSERILTYLSIAISTKVIDDIPVLQRNTETISLDEILENIENGGL